MVVLFVASSAHAQTQGTENGEWRYIGGDVWHTRYSPLDQVTAGNFEDLEIAWVWRGDNYGSTTLGVSRSTAFYVDGLLYTVAGQRQVQHECSATLAEQVRSTLGSLPS